MVEKLEIILKFIFRTYKHENINCTKKNVTVYNLQFVESTAT